MNAWQYDPAAAMARDPKYTFDAELGQWVLAPKLTQAEADAKWRAEREAAEAEAFVPLDKKLYDLKVQQAVAASEKIAEEDPAVRRLMALAEAGNTVAKPAMPITPAEYDARLDKLCIAAQEWNLQVAVVVQDLGMRGNTGVVSRNPLRLTRRGNTGDVLAQGDLADVERALLQFIADDQNRRRSQELLDEYHARINAERAEGIRREHLQRNAVPLIEAMQKQIDELRAERVQS
jgi:hypothetical protein